MAGHSKWAQIKRTKAVKDAKRGANFAQCSREIIMAAKLGGGDPEGNFRLRTAITRAKAAGVPNDNIKRAIEKGIGVGGADQLEDLSYEGYGPGGVAIFIEAMTDNRNRTAGDIRSYFNKYQGNLGSDGCVAWIFEQKGLIRVTQTSHSEEALFEHALEAGATDFSANPDEDGFDIFTEPLALNAVAQALTEAGISVDSAEVTRIPQNTAKVDSEAIAKPLLKLMDAIESHDDVQHVYANFEMDEALLAKLEQQ
ncbi:YebC/PmpR family DNA-binding transcriptional regulator [Vampirovibrio chlorellavorus]|uniref:YebC/PmpR family DNA-binding transcriptional regulator n=1 Tax=Vampirovibrio chlorellavorus TaxID=758823 RepID=UPI0026F0086E|nr:YebC/PmpR family DNA-binding transcriptional regulator [Vampirovibrio chlorellavorus]